MRMMWSQPIEAHVWILNRFFSTIVAHRSDFGEQPNPAGSQRLQPCLAIGVPGKEWDVCKGLREDFAGGSDFFKKKHT